MGVTNYDGLVDVSLNYDGGLVEDTLNHTPTIYTTVRVYTWSMIKYSPIYSLK